MSNRLKIKSHGLKMKQNHNLTKEKMNCKSRTTTSKTFQEVLIYTNRQMIIKLLNTIFMNLGDAKQLSFDDEMEKVYELLRALGHKKVRLCDFINWSQCENIELLEWKSSSEYLESDGRISLTNLGGLPDSNGSHLIVFKVWNGNEKLWSEIIKQYSNSEWIVDTYRLKSGNSEIFWQTASYSHSILLNNYKGNIRIASYAADDIETLETLYPIHYGFVKIHKVRLIADDNEWGAAPFLFFDTIMSMNDEKSAKWVKSVHKLEELPIELVLNIDRFSPYYSQLLQMVG